MVQTQGQRGDLHQNSHPYKINRDRGIELLAESMDANLELASDDPWAPFQETENWSVWEIRVVISGMNSCSHWFKVCRLRLSSATSDLTIPIESVTIKSTVRIQYKHLVLSTSIALPRKRPFRSHLSDVGKLRFYRSKPIADQMIGAVFCDSVRRRSFGHGMRVPRHVASVATRNRT